MRFTNTKLYLNLLFIIFFCCLYVITIASGLRLNSVYALDADSDKIQVLNLDLSRINPVSRNSFKVETTFLKPLKQTTDPDKITLLVTGDVNLARSINLEILRQKNPQFPFLQTKKILKSTDISLINLETPLTHPCIPTASGMKFCSSWQNVSGLLSSGIDLASLANNHSQDQGTAGFKETGQVLIKNGIHPLIQDSPVQVKLKGKKLTFLAYDLIWHRFSLAEMEASITRAHAQSDLLILFFHWGNEYTSNPSEFQRQVAQVAVDSGADLVLGSHPHWVQAIENYKHHLIVYSHANFIFDQNWSPETREGIIGLYTFKDSNLSLVNFVPVYINDHFQAEPASGKTADSIFQRLINASLLLSSDKN